MKQNLYVILLLAFQLVVYGCEGGEKAEQNEEVAKKSFVEKQAVKVSVQAVRQGDFARELVSNGKLKAKQKATLTFQVPEQVLQVKVSNGQRVQKGSILARVDPFKYHKQLVDSKNQYEKARIDLEDQLLGYGYALKDSLRAPANLLKMAKIRSGYNQALSNLSEAQRNLALTEVKAPISGIVANLEARPNNHSSQFKSCCEVINDAILTLEFNILEGEINQVKTGQAVSVQPFALNKQYKGHITAINPTVDEHGMISVQAQVKNPRGDLMDGMNARVLIKNEQSNCLIIPKTAVLYRQNRKVVFVHEEGIAKWVYVEIGEENSSEVTITDNSLKVGQEVIVSNNLNLAHETPVTINE
jgi:RND family efflux transporter MFP subunit